MPLLSRKPDRKLTKTINISEESLCQSVRIVKTIFEERQCLRVWEHIQGFDTSALMI